MYALKLNILNLGEDEKRAFGEVKILASLNHPRIVRYNTCWFLDVNTEKITSNVTSATSSIANSVPSDDICFLSSGKATSVQGPIARSKDNAIKRILCIQMEYCHQTLKEFIEKGTVHNNPGERNRIVKEIVDGLQYIHEQDIIHRDLKPNNIFLDKFGSVKIGDFGLSRHFSQEHTETEKSESRNKSLTKNFGTGFYISPEIMSGDSRYTELVDLYSLGVILFEVYYPLHSYHERSDKLKALREKEVIFSEDFDKVVKQPEVRSLISGLLQHNPEERLDTYRVLDILNKLETEEGMYEEEDIRISQELCPEIDNTMFHPFIKSIGIISRYESKTSQVRVCVCFRIGSKYVLSTFSRIKKYIKSKLFISFSEKRIQYPLVPIFEWKSNRLDVAILYLELPENEKASMPPALEIRHFSTIQHIYTVNKIDREQHIELKETSLHGDETNTYCETVLPYRNYGSPVFHLRNDNIVTVCGLAGGLFYEKGVKVGTTVVTMKEIFESLDPIIPRRLRKDLFSGTELYRCHENLMEKFEEALQHNNTRYFWFHQN